MSDDLVTVLRLRFGLIRVLSIGPRDDGSQHIGTSVWFPPLMPVPGYPSFQAYTPLTAQ